MNIMKRYLLLIVMALFCAKTFAQEYKPILKEGRVWKLVRPSYDNRKYEFDLYYTVTVGGDTLIGNTVCKKITTTCDVMRPWGRGFTYCEAGYEKDGKVYRYNDGVGGFELLMDFNLKKGDKFGYDDIFKDYLYCVDKVDSIEVNGEKYRRITISSGGPESKVYWVEGIGASTDGWIADEPRVTGNYNYAVMLGCIDDGKVVFTREDFDRWIPSDVEAVKADKKKDGRMYNISGQRIEAPSRGEVYIKDGEKRLAR